jgi:transposase
MPYTSNPYAPKARKLATVLVKQGASKSQVARLYGVHRATIGKWVKRATRHNKEHIQTKSSAPHHHPNQIPDWLEDRVVTLRKQSRRCAVIIHHQLLKQGFETSLSTVKRVLCRHHLIRKAKRARMTNTRFKRPLSNHPGALVEMDTIHFVTSSYSKVLHLHSY